ncbi:hypothetical protein [Avibacterium paragallinarum]|uniref:Uncharacterized protein n=1 Tax=Avibacterium paragallinarum TaxID=728 RepID=A0ABU7QEM1_AVIPA|nr:hypothetical protein [Avibacterium paragallinarum]MEE3607997.1 hypothetical protein [Avibacterium paragallinarum]MEE3620481.1 hypothetical protein [Avibacterium paragallinarum]MEE3667953.1 hypothetical protein [Avibacterium paragallinarum]MEE3679842.1 hypothetical protein [Avibacterium paragallinarum]MEE4385009.1 hypothetical protein [Avibacterium paragallinarum]
MLKARTNDSELSAEKAKVRSNFTALYWRERGENQKTSHAFSAKPPISGSKNFCQEMQTGFDILYSSHIIDAH